MHIIVKASRLRLPMVSALIDTETRRWNADLVRSLFFPFEANTIINMPLSYNLPEDKIIWVGNKRGEFTVKSAYYIALKVVETNEDGECSRGDARAPLWKRMWHLKILTKIRIFAWRACMNALPTRVNLHRRGVNLDVVCPMCDWEAESIAHSLLLCNSTRQVWNKWEDCPVKLDDNCIDFSEAAMRILNEGATRDLELFVVAAWSIWNCKGEAVAALSKMIPGQYTSLETEFIALQEGVLLAR
ncbi:hypothetical protein SO802_010748 [Lithocarpus litseifolius]|uniref:Reverse transcriptase zinc-binding domain-containing protein n=1 Tax=Lithocarpus litseifolius TaxID=425828 RepID=A0AAW2DKM8_9ROSI